MRVLGLEVMCTRGEKCREARGCNTRHGYRASAAIELNATCLKLSVPQSGRNV